MKTHAPVRSGELYLRRGPLENVHHIQPKGCAIRGLSIEMPSAMIDAWLNEASDGIARTLETLTRCPHSFFNVFRLQNQWCRVHIIYHGAVDAQ